MVRIGLLFVLLTTGCQGQVWEPRSPDGKFQVLSPEPLTEDNPSDKGPNDQIWAYTERYGRLMVWTSTAIETTDQNQIQDALKTLCDEVIDKSQAKVRWIKPIEVNGKYPGLEFEADRLEQKMCVRARVIYVPGRIYRLIAAGDRSWMSIVNVNRFLQSFEVIKEK